MRVRIRGQWWRIRVDENLKRSLWGLCNFDARLITLSPRATGKNHLGTVVHELIHAEFPDLDEEAVTRSANTIESVLWRMGYRPPADE